MGVKETPTSIKTYYKSLKGKIGRRIENAKDRKHTVEDQCKERHAKLVNCKNLIKETFNIDLDNYEEFTSNKYIDGTLLKLSKGLFINRKNNYELVSDLYDLLKYAKLQEKLHCIEKELELYNKINNLNFKEYTEVLRTYYTQVHKSLILDGYGYAFTGQIGWICVNRVRLKGKRSMLNYSETKKREAQLRKEGKRIWNKEEADWCKRNGLEYVAEDKRVFTRGDYYYEFPLLNCTLPSGFKVDFEPTDYRHAKLRGKTNDDLIRECNNDIKAICELPIDMRTKVILCTNADKILYTKYIRNETQASAFSTETSSKNRQ